MNDQLSISKSAREHFKKIIAKKDCYGILFKVKQAGCSGLKYDMDFIVDKPNDAEKLPYDGVNLSIDLEQVSLGQTKVVFFNPKAQNACGCGESFNLKGDSDG